MICANAATLAGDQRSHCSTAGVATVRHAAHAAAFVAAGMDSGRPTATARHHDNASSEFAARETTFDKHATALNPTSPIAKPPTPDRPAPAR